jgi:hypothetical protein
VTRIEAASALNPGDKDHSTGIYVAAILVVSVLAVGGWAMALLYRGKLREADEADYTQFDSQS